MFANGGYRVAPYVLDRLVDRSGQVLRSAKPTLVCPPCDEDAEEQPPHCAVDDPAQIAATDVELEDAEAEATTDAQSADPLSAAPEPTYACANRVLDERNAFIMNSMLQDVVRRGTGRRAWAQIRAQRISAAKPVPPMTRPTPGSAVSTRTS